MNLHKVVAGELVRALRGPLSQAQLNRKLGYERNQLYRWESGTRAISWESFEKLSRLRGIDLKAVLNHELGYRGRPEDFSELLAHLLGQSVITTFAKTVGISRSVLSRWLSGKGVPKLEAFLRIIDIQESGLEVFVSALLGGRTVPALEKKSRQGDEERNLHYAYPEVGTIIACLELSEYRALPKYVPGFIAERIGISLEREKKILDKMLEIGMLRESDKKFILGDYAHDMRGHLQGTLRLRKYWMEKALEKLTTADSVTEPHRFAHFVFSVSPRANEEIREAYYEFASRLKAIVTTDKDPKTMARALNIQDVLVFEGDH